MSVTLPFYPGCIASTVSVDSYGIFEFPMALLNYSIPYTMRINIARSGYQPISADYFVGGFPIANSLDIGTFMFYQSDNQSKYIHINW